MRRRTDVVTLCLLAMAAMPAVSARAQGRGAVRPSQMGTSSLSRTLGNLSTSTSSLQSLASRTRDVATINSPSGSPSRFTPGRAGAGYNTPTPSGRTSFGLSTRRLSAMSNSLVSPSYGSPVRYPELSLGSSPGLLMRRPGFGGDPGGTESLGLPQIARRDIASSRPGDAFEEPGRSVPLTQLASDYISARRTMYLSQAWQKFVEKDYRGATDRFSLARSLSAADPASRVEAEIGQLLSTIAVSQYSLAANSLLWLLMPVKSTGELPDRVFVLRLAELTTQYGVDPDFRSRLSTLDAVAIANQNEPALQALRCVMLWAKGDRIGAQFYARSPSVSTEPWSRLSAVMERAGSPASAATTQPASLGEPILPSQVTAVRP